MQVNKKSATFIDNIFSNFHECISTNLTTYISGHLPQKWPYFLAIFIFVKNSLENVIDRNDNQIQHRD